MDQLSFDIFEPEKKRFHITPNLIVFSLWGFLILFLWEFGNALPIGGTARWLLIGCIFIVTMYFLIRSFVSYSPLRGTMMGKMIFNDDNIVINEDKYKLNDLRNIDFQFIDFYGERTLRISANFNPLLSRGVNNYISFDNQAGATRLVYFRMMTKHSALTLYPFINSAVKLGAMSYYRAIDLIGVENVTKP